MFNSCIYRGHYAFFACFFLIIAGVSASFIKKNIYHLMVAGILIAVISFGVLVIISPSIIYKYNRGENKEVTQRHPGESELYGMKITQLLLPVYAHRLTQLAELTHRYDADAPLVNENVTLTYRKFRFSYSNWLAFL